MASAVATVAGAAIGWGVAGTATAAYIGASVGYKIYSASQERGVETGPSRTYSLGKLGMDRSHRLPVPIVYGRHLVSGNVIYEDIYGGENGNRYLDICLAVSEGPINTIQDVMADDISLDTSVYEGKLGERSQTTVSFHNDHFPYTAYIGAKLDAKELEINGSPTITSIIEGRKIDVYDGSSWTNQYSNNPAWVVYDFLTNSRYGMGYDEESVDENSFLSVADWCDTNNYTLNIVIDNEQSTLDILQNMLQAFNAFIIYTGGQISLKADTVENEIVQYFNQEDNIIKDSFSYSQTSKRDIPNKITVEYVEPEENWEMISAYYSNDQDIEERGEVINQNITLYGVTDFEQASKITRKIFNEQYYNRNICQFETTIKAIECEPGDVIAVTHDLPAWTDKEFRVMEIREKEDDTMAIIAREYNASIYTDEGQVYQQPTGPTLPNPWARPTQIPDTISLSEQRSLSKDGTHRSKILIEWDAPSDPFFKWTNIYIKKLGAEMSWEVVNLNNTWEQELNTTENWLENLGFALSDKPYGRTKELNFETEALNEGTYVVTLQAENRNGITAFLGGAPSAQIDVEGKVSEPSDVSIKTSRFINVINIEWFNIPDADLDAYELRTNQSFGSDDDNLIYRGDNNQVTLDSFPLPTFPEGTRSYTFYLKALDNSGNYSANATEITVTNAEPNPPTLDITEFFESLWIELEPPAGDPSINGFEIEVTPTGGTAEVFNVSAGERLTYSAEANTSYEIRARSYDIIGSGPWSIVYNASTKDIDSITQFASALRPATIVESLPVLPSDSYPVDSYVTLVARDTSGDITSVELYRNDSGSWVQIQSPDLENGMAVWPRVIAGTIQAGAISTDELAANAITADKVGANEIITYSANIADAVIESASIIDLDADKVTVGGSSTNLSGIVNDDFQSQYNTLYQRYLGLKESNYLPKPTYTWSATLDLGLSWTDNNVTNDQWSAIKLIDLWQAYDAEFSNLQTKLANKTTEQADYDNYYTAMGNLIDYMQYLENEMSRIAENNVYSNIGDMAYEDAVELAKLGDTIIEGGYLKTGLIDASRIDTGTLNADVVDVINLSASNISTGTLDANTISVINLSASNIETGTLNTANVTVQSSDGNTTFDGNTITVKDKNGTTRVKIGDLL